MSTVALVRCESYDYPEVVEAVERGIGLLGGAGKFAKSGEKILLKPNFLAGDPPEKCTNTHFTVFKAVAEIFKKTGARLFYGDSPGFGSAELIAKKCRIFDAAEEAGVEYADFSGGEDIFFEKGIQNKKFTIAKAVLESDGIISLPKLKTHAFAIMTGAIKNQFGCIPGLLKGEYHVKLPDPAAFARMLADLNNFIRPRIFIMDGIMAMEGNGPRGGKPRKMNVLLFSADPVALDATVCRIVKLDPAMVPTIRFGREAGLGTWAENEIEITGDPVKDFSVDDFDIKSESAMPSSGIKKTLGTLIIKMLGGLLVNKPYIIEKQCVKCGVCVKMCPVKSKAVDWHDGDRTKPPAYKYDRCIKCFCCQELCPENAIGVKVPLFRKIFGKKKNARQVQ